MFTLQEYRARYARSSSQELIDLMRIDQGRLTPEARRALAEEAARRGLDPAHPPTVQSVVVERPSQLTYPTAPIGQRFSAYVVDRIIGLGPLIMAAIFHYFFRIGAESATVTTINTVATIAWAVYYGATKDARANGQSIGKKLFGLMVLNLETDGPCTLGQSIGRALVMALLGGIPLIGWLIEPIAVVSTSDGRRLGDRAAGTQVIRASVYEVIEDVQRRNG